MASAPSVRAIHRRATRIELAVLVTLATTLQLLAHPISISIPHWSAIPILAVASPTVLDVLLAVGLVAALATAIVRSAARHGGQR